MDKSTRTIPTGARCLSVRAASQKLGRSLSWTWARVKDDPTFPRPVYLAPNSPVFLEHEIEAWLATRINATSQAA
jgi:prophage regulatory protein